MDTQPQDTNQPAGPPPAPQRPDPIGSAAASLGRAGRASAGALGRAASGFGNWLASIGWGKFLLLSLLLLVVAGILDSMFGSHRSDRDIQVPVDVKVTVDSNGLHITPAPAHADAQKGPANVQIDKKGGVRIRTNKDGHDRLIVIDKNGVRVEEVPPPLPGPLPGAPPPAHEPPLGAPPPAQELPPNQVTVPPDVLADPDKVAEAVEAAKDQIEEIVQDQVKRELAGVPRVKDEPMTWPDVAALAALLAFVLSIVKVALGSKRRAETRAQAADEAAAEEGLKRQLAEARLKTMQAQVEPHFLFNTLASVEYLIETDPSRASRMQKNLIQFLRAALPQMRQSSSTLGQEMGLCRSYLEILKMRMDDRLQFAITMPAGLWSAAFPPMMLQTLVENAIKHGLEPKPEGGSLTLSADVVNGNLRVAVSDTGLGFGAATTSVGGGVGLTNVRERLQALFGGRARLTIEANSPSGTIATIEVPYTVASPEAMTNVAPQPA